MLDQTKVANVSIPAGELYDALKRVEHAMSQEETRYYLRGAFLHFDTTDNLAKLVATDGHRMAVVALPNMSDANTLPSVIIPADGVAAMLKSGLAKRILAMRGVCLNVSPASVQLLNADGTPCVECVPVDGTFPDYQRVIPRGRTQSFELNAEDFRKAVAAVYGFTQGASDKAHSGVKFDFRDKQCRVSVESEGGAASVTVETCEPVNAPIQIGFNGRYVLDILKTFAGHRARHGSVDNTVTLHLTDAGSPTRFSGRDGYDSHAVNVCMPVRI